MSSLVVVDDHAYAIQYQGNWTAGGIYPEYDTTTSGSHSQGDTATFTFTGTWIGVYASTGAPGGWGFPITEFTIDGGQPASFTSLNVSSQSYHFPVFQSDILEDGQHTLVINHTDAGPSTFWFDYLEYMPSSSDSSKHLSSGALAGAVVGSVIGGVLLAALVAMVYLYRKEKREKRSIFAELSGYQRIAQQPVALLPYTPQVTPTLPSSIKYSGK
ncbi:hypothetical protein CONPUDRAFT_157086 [Coniophora puteana RWD-64-598 SS2]|uniref:Uncharacterized protein n=1 Tax=Coniophora puteana (strain RWD-64-598) TaxID=741705 RepID=A0A5M3MG57_CONPW|nr:uncharacterized protein CONPUDRAFT_157086 [Coniophora puteana RWD-64-598 SS2]EIW77910.1 hypothetical protein CONPUDRAFT_157086 [Coniophora puteana RWD-64-598 SS2]